MQQDKSYFHNRTYFSDKDKSNQLKRKQKENLENKLQKCIQSNKSPQINNGRDTKCQCKSKRNIQNISIYIFNLLTKAISNQFAINNYFSESCTKDSGNQCCSTEQVKRTAKYNKNAKVAKAIDHLSRRITIAKKKMEIKVDLGKMFLQFSIIFSYVKNKFQLIVDLLICMLLISKKSFMLSRNSSNSVRMLNIL